MSILLSEHFTLEELIFSETASRKGIDNTPSEALVEHAKLYLVPGLERIRIFLGQPLHINSGYRSPELNAIVPGSSDTSQHTKFEAGDLTCKAFSPYDLARILINNQSIIKYDQLIYEYKSWVHVSFSSSPRGSVLTKNTGTPYQTGLIK